MNTRCSLLFSMAFATLAASPALAFTQQIDIFGGQGSSGSGSWAYKFNTYSVAEQTQLEEIEFYLDPQVNNAEVVFVVYEPSPNFEWQVLWDSGNVVVSGGAGWKSSGPVGVLLDAGVDYAIGVYLPGDDVQYWYENVGNQNAGWAICDGSYYTLNNIFFLPDPDFGSGTYSNTPYYERLTVTLAEDADGDGVDELRDCNDGDATIFPGATELCDGIDNDCDGVADDNVVYLDYFADGDGDGYGDAGTVESSCAGPSSGYVGNQSDCDDGDATVNPGASELCDGLDNDCDTNVDEALPYTDWYGDSDGDGYGDANDVLNSCDTSPPSGYADNRGDCDPTDATVYPDADEYCDGLDNDCDGEVDEEVVFRDFYEDADGDGYGDAEGAVQSLCDPVAPSGVADNADDCDDADDTVHPDADEICDGVDNDCDGEIGDEEADEDDDGSFACDDCDDQAADRFPGAEESCNGVDNDCDGDAPTEEDCDPNSDESLKPGCGCSAGPVGGSPWLVLLALAALARRRR